MNERHLSPRGGLARWHGLALLGAVLGGIWLIMWPVLVRFQENLNHSSCMSNLKQVGLGTFQYLQDYDERMPLVDANDTSITERAPLGWADAIQPYIRSQRVYWCTERVKRHERDGKDRQPGEKDYTDYWYNRQLSGVETKKFVSPAYTIILCGEGNDGTDATNARYSLWQIPNVWRTNTNSPLHRHLAGSSYVYADGHVKWMKPQRVDTGKVGDLNGTFAFQ